MASAVPAIINALKSFIRYLQLSMRVASNGAALSRAQRESPSRGLATARQQLRLIAVGAEQDPRRRTARSICPPTVRQGDATIGDWQPQRGGNRRHSRHGRPVIGRRRSLISSKAAGNTYAIVHRDTIALGHRHTGRRGRRFRQHASLRSHPDLGVKKQPSRQPDQPAAVAPRESRKQSRHRHPAYAPCSPSTTILLKHSFAGAPQHALEQCARPFCPS